MTEDEQTDKAGAPPCGLYMRISHDPDMEQWTPIISALSTAIKHRSGYTKNMHVLEIALDDDFSRDAMEKAAAFIQVAQLSGLVAILRGAPHVARDLDADGVIVETVKDVKAARAALGEDAIVGLACGHDEALPQQAAHAGADYVTLGTAQRAPAPAFVTSASMTGDDMLCAAIGPITNDTAAHYVQAGAAFIDFTGYILGHGKGAMQGAVNALYAVQLALEAPLRFN